MALAYVGSVNLGVLSPLSLAVSASLTASLTADVQVLIDLALNFSITPPTFALTIDALAEIAAGFTASLTITPPLPYIDLQAGLMLDVELSLSLELAAMIPFELALDVGANAGIFAYAYNGTGSDFGGAVGAALASGWPDETPASAPSNAMIVATVTPSVWTDVASFFDTIPPELAPGLTFLAQTNLGLLCGLAVSATGGLIAELKARLSGAIALSAHLAIVIPSIAASLVAFVSLLLTLEAAIEVGLPSVVFQLEAILKATADLNAKLDLLLKLTLSMSGGGAYVYTWDGPGSGLGPALTSAVGAGWPGGAGADLPANALVLGTVTPAVWTTMTAFFGGL